MIQIGKSYSLEIVKEVSFGIYVNAHELGQVLVPKKFVPKQYEVGQAIDVFLYLDSDDKVIATTQKPFAQIGEFAYLKVAGISEYGAFWIGGLIRTCFYLLVNNIKPLKMAVHILSMFMPTELMNVLLRLQRSINF